MSLIFFSWLTQWQRVKAWRIKWRGKSCEVQVKICVHCKIFFFWFEVPDKRIRYSKGELLHVYWYYAWKICPLCNNHLLICQAAKLIMSNLYLHLLVSNGFWYLLWANLALIVPIRYGALMLSLQMYLSKAVLTCGVMKRNFISLQGLHEAYDWQGNFFNNI